MRSTCVLPAAPVSRLLGLIEAMRETFGPDEVAKLAGALRLELDDILPVLRAAQVLGLALIEAGRYELTDSGREFADAGERRRKAIFREAVTGVPVIRAILDELAASPDGVVPREAIARPARGLTSHRRFERQLDTAIDWGRYAELFDYDADAQHFVATRSAS